MNKYSFYARFLPMVLVLSPIVITGSIVSVDIGQFRPLIASSSIAIAFSFLLSQLGRDAGKRKEPDLWKHWGGTPSVVLLRWSDGQIDQHTKLRYHERLQVLCPMSTIPDQALETNAPDTCNEYYAAWTKFLLSKTRDTKEFNLLFAELTYYGYRRNVWGLKFVGVGVVISCMVAAYGYISYYDGSFNPRLFDAPFYIAEGILLLFLIFWILIINKNWVRSVAFTYAQRLLETTEKL